MAQVSRFIEDFDHKAPFIPGLESQTKKASEKPPITTKAVSTKSKTISSSKISFSTFSSSSVSESFVWVRDLKTCYKNHWRQLTTCIRNRDAEAGSVSSVELSSASWYGASMTSEAELRREAKRNYHDYIFGRDDELSRTLTLEKSPTRALERRR